MLTRIEADARGRELRDEPLVPVRRPDADAVAAPQAEREQAGRELVGAALQVVPRQAQVLGVEDRRVARAVPRRPSCRAAAAIVMKRSGSSVEPATYEQRAVRPQPLVAAAGRASRSGTGSPPRCPRRRRSRSEVAPVAELLEGVRGAVDRRLVVVRADQHACRPAALPTGRTERSSPGGR